jgi:hypothetical protein
VTTTFNSSLLDAAKLMKRNARAKRYAVDPVMWAEDVLGIQLWSKQKEILRSLVTNKRTAVKSCHSIGKTIICAVASAWWVSTRYDAMVQSTAPTYQQVHEQLWEAIRKFHLESDLTGRVTLGDEWLIPIHKDGRQKDILVGVGKKPADSNIHGFHGTHRPGGVLAILDEGCGLHVSIFTGAEAITTAPQDRILTTGNPDDPNTEFGRIFREADSEWNLITVSAYDTPHFTGEDEQIMELARQLDAAIPEADRDPENPNPNTKAAEALLEGMPNPEWIASRARDWGEESPRFISKVLAQFPLTSIDSLFTAAEIETGRNSVIEPTPSAFKTLGVDVARYGSDKSVVVLNVEGHIEVLAAFSTMDTMQVAAQVHKLALEHKVDQVRVDGIGVGGGVVDRLVSLSRSVDEPYIVVEMIANASPPDRTLHRNSRAYWYDSVKYQLANDLIDLPDGPLGSDAAKLLQEMTGIKYSYPNGIMQIESKEDIRRRGDKSPDYVDALVLACAPINYLQNDPLANMRPGQMVEIDVLSQVEEVSPY